MSFGLKEKIKYWALPAGMLELYRESRTISLRGRLLSRKNAKFRNIHQGKRCFILCNGPSVRKQDLLPLKDEIVFSVGNGYHHKDFLTIQPKYHCVVRSSYNKYFRPKDILLWFNAMHSKIGSAELFLDGAEWPLIKKYNLLPGRKINYLYSGIIWNEESRDIIDIAKKIPGVVAAPILCMIIAFYMGFKNIYLLGVDNDWWKTGEYKYFFEPTVLKGKDECTHENGKSRQPLYQQFLGFAEHLHQYWIMHNIACANGISIFNATAGGALEEFPRVRLDDVLFGKYTPDKKE